MIDNMLLFVFIWDCAQCLSSDKQIYKFVFLGKSFVRKRLFLKYVNARACCATKTITKVSRTWSFSDRSFCFSWIKIFRTTNQVWLIDDWRNFSTDTIMCIKEVNEVITVFLTS